MDWTLTRQVFELIPYFQITAAEERCVDCEHDGFVARSFGTSEERTTFCALFKEVELKSAWVI